MEIFRPEKILRMSGVRYRTTLSETTIKQTKQDFQHF